MNLNRTSGINDARVAALGTRKVAVEAGVQVGIARNGVLSGYDSLSFGVTVVRDVAGIHHAVVVSPELNYSTPVSRRTFVFIGASASHAGDGYARAYFDVDRAGSLLSGLAPFSTRGGWKSVSASAAGLHSLSGELGRGWGLAVGVSYSRLLGDFARSPVTSVAGRRDQLIAGAGVAYSF